MYHVIQYKSSMNKGTEMFVKMIMSVFDNSDQLILNECNKR